MSGARTDAIKNLRKDKPNLYEIVIKSFVFDTMVEKSEQNLKDLQKEFENKS